MLTSVFDVGLSFMAIGQNLTCVRTLAIAAGIHMGCYKYPLWGPGTVPLESLAVSPIPGLQIAFPFVILWPNLFFRSLFACVRLAGWLCLLTTIWTYRKVFSKPHAHAFSCWPKRCWSQINWALNLIHNALSFNAMKYVGHQTTK